jgi:ubiquitin-like protein Nedd8
MQIQVKTLTGRQQTFNFEPSAKISEVKSALQEREGIQVDQIRLIFGGRQMADEKTLEEYNVQPGSVIHMVLQLRGGGF